jgi:hypothetical protein
VETKKRVLIVTDGADPTQKIAGQIAAELESCQVVMKAAAGFSGTDILPAEIIFLGCQNPDPPSFAYLADLLQHINLVGRPCGLFSPGSGKAAKYLTDLCRASELAIRAKPLVSKGGVVPSGVLRHWVESFLT